MNRLTPDGLEALISEYPYVSIYRVLLAKSYQSVDENAYRDALHQAALHSPDRVRLYELLHIPEAVEPKKQRKKKRAKKVTEDAKAVLEPQQEIVESPPTEADIDLEKRSLEMEVPDKEVDVAPPQKERPAAEEETATPSEPALKDTLMKSAAEKHISLDEKHTFLEWLDILENPEDQVVSKDEEALDAQVLRQHAASSYEAELHQEAKSLDETGADPENEGHGMKKVAKLADKSLRAGAGLATETLAQIMLKQGKINDAIAVYEQLRLKYPEKSDYFAALISDIKAR